MNSKTQSDWKQILKILIAVLTAITGALGVASCMSQHEAMSELMIMVVRCVALTLTAMMLM